MLYAMETYPESGSANVESSRKERARREPARMTQRRRGSVKSRLDRLSQRLTDLDCQCALLAAASVRRLDSKGEADYLPRP